MRGSKRLSVAYVNNIPTPYVSRMFAAWAKTLPGPLTVYYTAKDDGARQWTLAPIAGVDEARLPVLLSIPRFGTLNHGLRGVASRHDVIMLGGFEQASHLVLALWARLLGKSVVLTIDGFNPRRIDRENAIARFVKYWMTRLAHAFLANGTVSRLYLERGFGVRPERVFDFFLTPILADIERLRDRDAAARDDWRRELGLPPDRLVALVCGRFIGLKRIDLVLDAVHRIPAAQRPVVLLAGGGPLQSALEARARSLGVDAVFAGFREGEALARCYLAADYLVLASDGDAWGLVVHEAMAAGLPVIVSDACGIALDIADGKSGYTFPAGDAVALADALGRVATDDRATIGSHGRALLREWTPDASARSLLACLKYLGR